jgi:dihydroflavonol-4-reductase
VHRDTRALEGLAVERVPCDITDARSVSAACAGAEVVYHLAACIRVDSRAAGLVHAVNVGGTENVLRACRDHGVRRLVHFSSIHALDYRPTDAVIDEQRPWVPDQSGLVYDRSKAAADRRVLQAVQLGLDAVIIYPTAVLGPWDFKPSPLGGVIARLARGRMPVLVAGGFDWVDARDVAAGARAAEERGRPGQRYLLSGHWCAVRDLAAAVAEISGRPSRRVTVPAGWARAAFYLYSRTAWLLGRSTVYTPEAVEILQRHRLVSSAKAAGELGYRSRPLRETLADTVAWWAGREGTPAT